jgi:hypothetical protein
MHHWARVAAFSAIVIFIAFFMHNLNAWFIEPRYLGFEDPATDYAKVEKLVSAIGSLPWTLSGLGHLLSGFAAAALGLAVNALFATTRPIASRMAMAAGLVSATGFMLTGIVDMVGGKAMAILAGQNPEQLHSVYLAGSLLRVAFNGLAVVGFGWLAIQLSWCGIKSRRLPARYCNFGFLTGLAGLTMAFVYVPVYLVVFLVYTQWTAITFFRVVHVPGSANEP